MSTTATETAAPSVSTGVNLRAYGGELENVKPLPPFTPDTPIEELRRRYEEDGVVWVRYQPPWTVDRVLIESRSKVLLAATLSTDSEKTTSHS